MADARFQPPPSSPNLSADFDDIALPEYSNDDEFHQRPATLSVEPPEYSFYAPKDSAAAASGDTEGGGGPNLAIGGASAERGRGYSDFVPVRDPDAPNIVVSTPSNGLVSTEQQLAIDTPYLSFADKLFTKYRDYYQTQTQGKKSRLK